MENENNNAKLEKKVKITTIVEDNKEITVLPSVETAVNWWTDKLTRSSSDESLGDDFDSYLIMLLTNNTFPQVSIDEDQIKNFKEILSKKIMDKLNEGLKANLDVNYGPSGILLEAITESGLKGYKAPYKTEMVVDVDSVKVSEGYRTTYKEIFENKNEIVKSKKLR